MPKFSANLSMLFTEVAFLDRFEKAHEAGFKAVECLFPYEFDPWLVAEKLEQYGLEQVLFNTPRGNKGLNNTDKGDRGLAAVPGREKDFRQSIETALHYAQILNCKKVHVLSGMIDNSHSFQAHEQTFLENIRYVADRFNEHGISVMIEPLNQKDAPNYFLSNPQEAARLIRKAECPNLKLQLDLYHAQMMNEDLPSLIEELAPYTGHVQIASAPGRHEPNHGETSYSHWFEVLDNSGYNSWIGCEYHPKTTTGDGLGWLSPYL